MILHVFTSQVYLKLQSFALNVDYRTKAGNAVIKGEILNAFICSPISYLLMHGSFELLNSYLKVHR